MAIIKGKDKINTNFYSDLVGLYYYVLPANMVNDENSKFFGYVPTIQSVNYNPFIEIDDYTAVETKLDNSHWGSPSNKNFNIYRLVSLLGRRKKLGEYDLTKVYNELPEDFESILLNYPFKYYLLTDYMNPPILIKPQLHYKNNNKFEVYVTISLSQSSKYNLFIKGYKGDNNGNIEGMINNNPMLFPVSSSAYSSFLASSQSTFNQSNNLALLENDKSLQQGNKQISLSNEKNAVNTGLGVVSALTNLFNGNIGGAVGGVTSSLTNGYYDFRQNQMNSQNLQENTNMRQYQIESMAMSKKDDLLNTPRAIKSLGNDALFNMLNSNKRVDLLEYGITPSYEWRIGQYFKRYGYEVGEYKRPNIRSRKYWNFIKTVNCEITSGKIPRDNMEEIKSIFNKGVTFWHMDNGAIVKDYTKNNVEV